MKQYDNRLAATLAAKHKNDYSSVVKWVVFMIAIASVLSLIR